jgi:hypothetical protein
LLDRVLLGWSRMFNKIPTAIMPLSMELSPELINGNGIPVFGSIWVATPMLTKTWNMNMEAKPTAMSIPI